MKNIFNSIQLTKPKNNVFDLSHDVKMSLDWGKLTPTCAIECVPGDKFNISNETLIRMAPMIAPVMHRIDCYMHYFFVPNRILWENWEKFITNTPLESGGSVLPAFPTLEINNGNSATKSLADYLGIPKISGSPFSVSALPFAAYQAIYHEYYRDQNLIEEFDYTLNDGSNDGRPELTEIRKRAWEHDYFTASLPFAQKGQAVDIPLGDVVVKDNITGVPYWQEPGGSPQVDGNVIQNGGRSEIDTNNEQAIYNPDGTLEVDGTTINDLRRAFRLQEWLEKAARGGSRYIENILMHFGVRSSDKRLQRPEYITGSKSTVVISEVLNTTGTATQPQGNMAGHGVTASVGGGGSYYCEEHGYIIGIMSIMPKTAYYQGVPRHFIKTNDPFEFYWPSFAHIGEQEVKQIEIYADTASKTATFGYVPRYAEYKFCNSRVAGDFKESLEFWHLGRKFSSDPNLNQQFIECNPSKRIFAVDDDAIDSFYCHVFHKIRAVRPMPVFGTPSF